MVNGYVWPDHIAARSMLGNTWLQLEAQLELALEQAVRWHRTAALLSSKGTAVSGVSTDTVSENND